MIHKPLQFALGGILLAGGLLFYFGYREAPIALFEFFGIQPLTEPLAPDLTAGLAASLPSFIHALSLSLLTGALVRPGHLRYLAVCLFWLLIDASFELAQAYGKALAAELPEWVGTVPFLGAVEEYLRYGGFDRGDITGVVLGACLAYVILVVTGMRTRRTVNGWFS